jgi:mRNA interferase RelE/StbE
LCVDSQYRYTRYCGVKQIVFTPAALRQWTKLTPAIRERIEAKLEAYASTGSGDVKRLKGQDGCRLRIGDWRAVFIDGACMTVVAVGHRREIYD